MPESRRDALPVSPAIATGIPGTRCVTHMGPAARCEPQAQMLRGKTTANHATYPVLIILARRWSAFAAVLTAGPVLAVIDHLVEADSVVHLPGAYSRVSECRRIRFDDLPPCTAPAERTQGSLV